MTTKQFFVIQIVVEKTPNNSLSIILSDIVQEEQHKTADQKKEEERIRKSRELYVHALEIADRHGVKKPISVMTGAGPRIMGAHLEYTTHKVTPPVVIATEQGELALQLVEEIIGGTGHTLNRAGYSLRAQQAGEGAQKTQEYFLFHFAYELVTNWHKSRATIEQMEIASELLLHIQSSLGDRQSS